MIYTVTLNPSLDYFVELDQFEKGMLNRAARQQYLPGGKGINVSRVLRQLGIESKALGFAGGFTGDFIRQALESEQIEADFTRTEAPTRINVKIHHGSETEINGKAPDITEEQVDHFYTKLETLQAGDILVLSGSVPSSVPVTVYQTLAEIAQGKGARVIIDTSGSALKESLKSKPFLIKPNQHELEELTGASVQTLQDACLHARSIIGKGIEVVIVSMGGQGAALITKEQSWIAEPPTGQVVNSVGAGDSLVAGFIAKFTETGDLISAFQYGIACGSATAFHIDLCTKEMADELVKLVNVHLFKE
ncbi:1-phosphofructokinase [Fictibacillus sp. Mic-4]|uniref:1-phosphofructokinase n=1 Tax=Fictibacillus sp. Mic-4 TaxID=3132826 RepID=UPI003CE9D3A1